MFHDVKNGIKKNVGFSAFHTTPQNVDFPKSLTFNRRYRRKKPLYEYAGFYRHPNPQTTAFFPIFLICYNNAITYFKRSFLKCI